MWIPVALALGSVALGTALGLLPLGQGKAIRAVSVGAMLGAIAVVFAHLLPEAFEARGTVALVLFAAALFAPSGLEQLAARAHRRASARDLLGELNYAALLVYSALDGVGLYAYAHGEAHGHHGEHGVAWVIAGHTVPLVAVVTMRLVRHGGRRVAFVRGAGLAVATVLGIGLGAWLSPSFFEAFAPEVGAITSGLLAHVLFHDLWPGVHDHDHDDAAGPPPSGA